MKRNAAIRFAQDRGVAVFAVGLADPSRNLSQRQGDATSAAFEPVPAHFRLASGTGGLKFSPVKPGFQALPETLRWLSDRIKNDYVVGVYPSPTGLQKRHKVEVVLRGKRHRVLGGRTLIY